MVQKCLETGRRGAPLYVAAVNRLGKTVTCAVLCSPFSGHNGGVVLLMEQSRNHGSG